MVQLAWRFLVFQKKSDLVRWYRGAPRKTGGSPKAGEDSNGISRRS